MFFRLEATLPVPAEVAYAHMLTRLADGALQRISLNALNRLRHTDHWPASNPAPPQSLFVLTGSPFRRGRATVMPLRWELKDPCERPGTADPVLDANLEIGPVEDDLSSPTLEVGNNGPGSALVLIGVYRPSTREKDSAAAYDPRLANVLARTFLHATAHLLTTDVATAQPA